MELQDAVRVLMEVCGNAKRTDKILFVSDDTSREIGEVMWERTSDYPNRSMIHMTDREMHGCEPPEIVAAAMAASDVFFCITKFSLTHTDARRNAVKKGARYVNMADYSLDMMREGSLSVDFAAQDAWMYRVAEAMDHSRVIRLTTEAGTDLVASVQSRNPIRQPGRALTPGSIACPPAIETAFGPVEGTANGVLVVDGSIPFPGLGVVERPIKLTVRDGRIVRFEGGEYAEKVKAIMEAMHDDKVFMVGEIGMGFNDKAAFCSRMLVDEDVMGTAHIGFGSNISFGGAISGSNHLDMVFCNPTIVTDGRTIMDNGVFQVK